MGAFSISACADGEVIGLPRDGLKNAQRTRNVEEINGDSLPSIARWSNCKPVTCA